MNRQSSPGMQITLDQLNALDQSGFVAVLGGVYAKAPSVAERASAARPFATVAEDYTAMQAAVAASGEAEQMVLIRGHPELAGKVARAGTMTAESRSEQGSLGLDKLSDAEFARFERL